MVSNTPALQLFQPGIGHGAAPNQHHGIGGGAQPNQCPGIGGGAHPASHGIGGGACPAPAPGIGGGALPSHCPPPPGQAPRFNDPYNNASHTKHGHHH